MEGVVGLVVHGSFREQRGLEHGRPSTGVGAIRLPQQPADLSPFEDLRGHNESEPGMHAHGDPEHVGLLECERQIPHPNGDTDPHKDPCTAISRHLARDGLSCCAAVANASCLHSPIVVGQSKPRDLPELLGLTPFPAISRRPCPAPFMPSTALSTLRPTSPPSLIASTADSICAGWSLASSSMRLAPGPGRFASFGTRDIVSNRDEV